MSKSPEECFHKFKRPIARVPGWLKEASATLESKGTVNTSSDREKASTKAHCQARRARVYAVSRGCHLRVGGLTGKMGGAMGEKRWVQALLSPATRSMEVACSLT